LLLGIFGSLLRGILEVSVDFKSAFEIRETALTRRFSEVTELLRGIEAGS
jgi:hypothetical protein